TDVGDCVGGPAAGGGPIATGDADAPTATVAGRDRHARNAETTTTIAAMTASAFTARPPGLSAASARAPTPGSPRPASAPSGSGSGSGDRSPNTAPPSSSAFARSHS